MSLNADDTHSEYLRQLHDDGGGGLADASTIADRIADDMSQLATIYTDRGDIPSSATVRLAGVFTDPYAAFEYLNNGGLAAFENNGNVIPIGFVYVYAYFDELLQVEAYEIWIDEDTG